MDSRDALKKLMAILQEDYDKLIEANKEEVVDGMLALHRVLLVMINSHENKMSLLGIDDDLIDINIKAVEDASEIVDKTIPEDFDIITMPGGDA